MIKPQYYIKSLVESELAELEEGVARAMHQFRVCGDEASARLVEEYRTHVSYAKKALRYITERCYD